MAQLIGGRACENGGISGELKHGPETSEAIREAFVRGGSINFIMYPWISAGDNYRNGSDIGWRMAGS